jgi:tetratricopeptide (TPR) repeat protein
MEDHRPSVLRPAIDPALEMSDSDLFWQEHWRKFAYGLAGIILAVLVVGASMFWRAHVRSSGAAAYSVATSVDGWRAVIEEFPGSIAAGNAQLQIATALRVKGDLDAAATELEAFTAAQPEHPLAGVAWLTLGEIRQAQDKIAPAIEAYRTASSRYKTSYAAPLALISEAKLLATQGNQGEARAILESVSSLYPETPAAMISAGELERSGQPQGTPAPATTP